MRVLFSSTWGYGHIFPMVPLARAFAAAGHEVRWATSAGSARHVVDAGIDAVPAGLDASEVRAAELRIRTELATLRPEHRAAHAYPNLFARAAAPAMLTDLLPFARAWQPALLVHEHAELAAPLVAELLGVPSVTHSFGGGIPPAILESAREVLAPVWEEHGRTIPPSAGHFTGTYLDICPPRVQTVGLDHILTVQALRPVSYTGTPASCRLRWPGRATRSCTSRSVR